MIAYMVAASLGAFSLVFQISQIHRMGEYLRETLRLDGRELDHFTGV